MTIIQLAEVCYESVRASQRVLQMPPQHVWHDIEAEQKRQIENSVKRTLTDPNDTLESTHEAWYKHMEARGWRYGTSYNENLKEHPDMLPFNMQPKHMIIASKLHVAIINALKDYVKPAE